MLKNTLKFLIMTPLLMAFQCENDEIDSTLIFNVYKAKVTQEASFSINDTIWIEGKISSKAFDFAINDSVFVDFSNDSIFVGFQGVDVFSIYKFIEPTTLSNCRDAIDQFELISDRGELTFLSRCENESLYVSPELNDDNQFYSYKIGLKPKNTGDYLISWRDGILQNAERNEFIIENYRIPNRPNEIGFIGCGMRSWRFLSESDKEYYFSVQ